MAAYYAAVTLTTSILVHW